MLPDNLKEALESAPEEAARARDDATGESILHVLALREDAEAVAMVDVALRMLPVDTVDARGMTALHVCLSEFNPVMVSLLLVRGANVHAKDAKGRNCIAIADKIVSRDYPDLVVNVWNEDGEMTEAALQHVLRAKAAFVALRDSVSAEDWESLIAEAAGADLCNAIVVPLEMAVDEEDGAAAGALADQDAQ
jgi:hypothetical protein